MTMPTVTIGGTNLAASMLTVFSDANDTLKETIGFYSETRSPTHASANWVTHYSVRLGVREAASGSWEIFLYPTYGTHLDTQRSGRGQPYYTRITIQAVINGTTVTLDSATGAATVIGHGQSIPPTVVNWNNNTNTISSTVEGHTLAFADTKRILGDPLHTGFEHDGEFCMRYDHTVESEGRETFYAAACWPGHFIKSDGSYLRGDRPDAGQTWGWAYSERGPYARYDDRNATNYPIQNINWQTWGTDDEKTWTNTWRVLGYTERLDSGIGPFMLNIHSRGKDYMTDFGMSWLTKSIAARLLTHFANPYEPHTKAIYSYNYDTHQMRGKGRLLWAFVVTWRALYALSLKRTGDPEVTLLLADMTSRIVSHIRWLKADYANNSWLEYTHRNTVSGTAICYWQMGNYWQGLLLLQEAILEFLGTLDPDIDTMMRTLAAEIHEHTYYWEVGQPHPIYPSVNYTGAYADRWSVPYYYEIGNLPTSLQYSESTAIGSTLIAVYEWAKKNGIDQGAKQDAIISGNSGEDYKWKLGDTSTQTTIALKAAATMAMTVTLGAITMLFGLQSAASMAMTATATLQIVGGELPKVRTGTAIACTDTKSIGTAIAVGPGI